VTERALPGRTGLLIVDVQRGFVNDATRDVPPRIAALLDRAAGRFSPIVASRFVNVEGSPCRVILESESNADSPDTDLCEGISRPGVEVLEKRTYALGPPLGERLEAASVEALVIVGVDTHACVLHEALDAFDRGIRPIVPEDLCASGDGEEAHGEAASVLRRAIGVHNVWPSLDGAV
jgi:nicotinamidase-related amidase